MSTIVQIIGSGLLATAIKKYSPCSLSTCYFASGVANSTCTDDREFGREESLLLQTMEALSNDIKLVYFGTCSVYDSQLAEYSPYVAHKLKMESLVMKHRNYIVFRLPQVVGFTQNKFTLLNYLRDCIVENRLMHIQRFAIRNLIDVDDVAKLVVTIDKSGIHDNSIVNIANPHGISVIAIVTMLEKILGSRSRYDLVNSGSEYSIDTTVVEAVADACSIDFSRYYVEHVLRKYYSPTVRLGVDA